MANPKPTVKPVNANATILKPDDDFLGAADCLVVVSDVLLDKHCVIDSFLSLISDKLFF